MSAEALGRELLGELKEEGLDELLHSLRELEAPTHAPLGFAPLDTLLDVFQNPPLTRQQQQFHHTDLSNQHQAPHSAKEKPLPVLEIAGATACSGKTQLLYHLIALSLLPAQFNDISVCGKGSAVILFDLSSKFSVVRLHGFMQNLLLSMCWSTSSSLPEHEISSLISDSLKHLHVFRPQSSSCLLATLRSLSSYLLARPSTHFSSNRPAGLLAINDLSSFLWQDRLDADEEVSLPISVHAERASTSLLSQRYRTLVSLLRDVQHRFSCTIVATSWGLSPITSVAGHRALRPNLPSVWSNLCTVNVVVERDRVSKFGPGMSAEEALTEGPQRWEAVEKSGCSGWVNWWGSEGWREEVREGVKALEVGGTFSFRVTNDGLQYGDVEH